MGSVAGLLCLGYEPHGGPKECLCVQCSSSLYQTPKDGWLRKNRTSSSRPTSYLPTLARLPLSHVSPVSSFHSAVRGAVPPWEGGRAAEHEVHRNQGWPDVVFCWVDSPFGSDSPVPSVRKSRPISSRSPARRGGEGEGEKKKERKRKRKKSHLLRRDGAIRNFSHLPRHKTT